MSATRTLTVDQIDLKHDESITLSYSRGQREWWAVLWRDAKPNDIVLESTTGSTPVTALAELLMQMGARPDRTN